VEQSEPAAHVPSEGERVYSIAFNDGIEKSTAHTIFSNGAASGGPSSLGPETVRTGQVALRITFSVTEPSTSRSRPDRP
jgi:hypothetical protein